MRIVTKTNGRIDGSPAGGHPEARDAGSACTATSDPGAKDHHGPSRPIDDTGAEPSAHRLNTGAGPYRPDARRVEVPGLPSRRDLAGGVAPDRGGPAHHEEGRRRNAGSARHGVRTRTGNAELPPHGASVRAGAPALPAPGEKAREGTPGYSRRGARDRAGDPDTHAPWRRGLFWKSGTPGAGIRRPERETRDSRRTVQRPRRGGRDLHCMTLEPVWEICRSPGAALRPGGGIGDFRSTILDPGRGDATCRRRPAPRRAGDPAFSRRRAPPRAGGSQRP